MQDYGEIPGKPIVNRDSLLIFLISIVLFTVGLNPEFIGFDCRFAMFAQEMLRNGPTFFPTTYDQPYPDYPGTSTFMIYLVSLLFGKVTPLTAILPTAIVSALILVVIYRIGAMHSRKWGLFAVLLALFTKEFFSLSRHITTDQYTSLATVLCFYLAYSATVYGRQKRLWFVPLLFIASFAFRGPIGFIIPASVLCVYYLYNRDFKKVVLIASASVVLLVVCSIVLLAAAKYQGGEALVKQVIEMQVTGRFRGDVSHWIGYYWTDSFAKYAIAYPFAVIVVVALYKKILGQENADYKLLSSLVLWILIVLIGMSIPNTKKIRYVLPMIPAVALVGSYMFCDPMQKGILPGIKKIFLQFCSLFPLGTAITILAAWALNRRFEFLSGANYFTVIVLTIILAAAALVLNIRFKESVMRDLVFTAVGTLTFIVIVVGIAEPIDYSRERTLPFVEKVESLRNRKPGDIVFYKINADSEAIKFMANLDKPINPQFINSPEAILNCKVPAYFIAMDKDFDALPQNIAQRLEQLDNGKIGVDDCVVFSICGSLQQ